jgi:hypothetical protein
LIALGAVVGVAISLTGPNDELHTANPATYNALESASAPFADALIMLIGHPDIVRVIDPYAAYPNSLGDYGTFGIGQQDLYLQAVPEEIDILSPRATTAELDFTAHRTSAAVLAGSDTTTIVGPDGRRTTYRFHRHFRAIINLHFGLNVVTATAVTQRPLVTGALPRVLRLSDLRLRVVR